ncbi:hypothetical protein M407DRAFT_163639 [Tulasnella calospora MUT 4182]|uniref:Uncharacterized protein n=1 Tax=Tulasnella calospora MUT 4182 TaxID=1051891 RepID=A0A0C3QNQ5_9AGAM|nr:hypothetical protein M407DRAFT_163639 [Tulasnella calospora MUT 4182]
MARLSSVIRIPPTAPSLPPLALVFGVKRTSRGNSGGSRATLPKKRFPPRQQNQNQPESTPASPSKHSIHVYHRFSQLRNCQR